MTETKRVTIELTEAELTALQHWMESFRAKAALPPSTMPYRKQVQPQQALSTPSKRPVGNDSGARLAQRIKDSYLVALGKQACTQTELAMFIWDLPPKQALERLRLMVKPGARFRFKTLLGIAQRTKIPLSRLTEGLSEDDFYGPVPQGTWTVR